MPAIEQSELERVCQAVSGFVEDSLRYAIEQAKDPDKAMQLVERLEEELAKKEPEEPFTAVALAVVLGEAKVEAAIPVLLSMMGDAKSAGGLVQEAGTYALQRMGTPALLATMAHIESITDPAAKVEAYWVLHAAMDADEPTRLAVQEFCRSRLAVERPVEKAGGWDPLRAALSVSVVLGDQRVKPILEELAKEAKDSGDKEEAEELGLLLEDLESGTRWDYEVDWRTDWPEVCAEWRGMLMEWQDQEAAAAKTDELKGVHANLVEEYRQFLVQEGIPAAKAEVAKETVGLWLELAAKYGLDARNLTLDLTRQVLLEHAPAELIGDRHYFEGLPSLLESFFLFLHNTGRLEDTRPYEALVKETRRRLPDLAMDRSRWGLRKLMYMVGKERGYDMDNDEESMKFVQELMSLVTADVSKDEERSALPPEELLDERITPIRRIEPKVGRNDPCPCGSGKKYKKCCGK